jgi:hypothetical protein
MSLAPMTLAFADGRINLAVAGVEGIPSSTEAWLCGLAKTVTVTIARGENKGRTIAYHNVVRRWVKLGDWTGGHAGSWSIPVQSITGDGIDEVAVLVQAGTMEKPKAILGAAFAAIH